MSDVLVIVDMQNDFIDGALGTKEAQQIVSAVREKAASFNGRIFFTMDTHGDDYLETQEGRKLPVPHCIKGTDGWMICGELSGIKNDGVIEKPTFGSVELGKKLLSLNETEEISSVTLVGLCTDICVISNAMLIKAFLPETRVIVDQTCCAGVSTENHRTALRAMEACQIEII